MNDLEISQETLPVGEEIPEFLRREQPANKPTVEESEEVKEVFVQTSQDLN